MMLKVMIYDNDENESRRSLLPVSFTDEDIDNEGFDHEIAKALNCLQPTSNKA